jgi:cysteinyl-tRNA synthetase
MGSNLEPETAVCEEAFGAALDDDLNISAALGVVFDFVRDTNRSLDKGEVGAEGARKALDLLDRLDAVTGVLAPPADDAAPPDIMALVNERQQARRDKDFARSDAIRAELVQQGWTVEDTADGPRVKRQ